MNSLKLDARSEIIRSKEFEYFLEFQKHVLTFPKGFKINVVSTYGLYPHLKVIDLQPVTS